MRHVQGIMAKKKRPTKKKVPNATSGGKILPIRHVEGGLGEFANHMIVQATNDEIHLAFFQIQPPIVLGHEAPERIVEIDHIDAKPVARIIVTQAKLPGIIEALQKQLPAQSGKVDNG